MVEIGKPRSKCGVSRFPEPYTVRKTRRKYNIWESNTTVTKQTQTSLIDSDRIQLAGESSMYKRNEAQRSEQERKVPRFNLTSDDMAILNEAEQRAARRVEAVPLGHSQ